MNTSKNSIIKKNKEIFDYMEDANKKILLSGKQIDPTCYAIVYNKKEEFSIYPIPLSQAVFPSEREALLKMMAGVLRMNKVKVKMFLMVTVAIVQKKDYSEEPKNCLLVSARDYLDNQKNTLFEISEANGVVNLTEVEKRPKDGWVSKKSKGIEDSLLNTIWKEYRRVS